MKRLVQVAMAALVVAVAFSATTALGAGDRKPDAGTRAVRDAVARGTLPLAPVRLAQEPATGRAAARAAVAAAADTPVGTVRVMPVLDDVAGAYDLQPFTLRAVGQHVEVWVQGGATLGLEGTLDFPEGDCRNDGVRNVVTDAQVAYLVDQFDTVIYPRESTVFSVPATRDGAAAVLPDLVGLPADYYAGDGDKIVTLVSNVREDNFYDTDNAGRLTYIAGFFSSQVSGFLDRNVMTIDGFDWLHRTGADPIDEPSTDACTSAPARPFLYEGVFAHEYQHLLESYEDADESTWVNEGLSDWAQTLTGYVTPGKPITDKSFDSHIQCFAGFLAIATPVNPNPRAECGPENSLTRWEDQGPAEILADYGAAYSMMELLAGRYGTAFMTALHRGEANGFAAIDEALAAIAPGSRAVTATSRARGEKGDRDHRDDRGHKVTARTIFEDWTLAVALDGLVDAGARLEGAVDERDVRIPTLSATVLWSSPEAYASPGAPPNGSDYVQLRNAQGTPLRGGDVDQLSFAGATTLPSSPLQWTVVADPPGQPGNPALWSGTGDDRDEAAVRSVTVPAGGGTLAFRGLWDLELGWDYAYVQVSVDGGTSYVSLACTAPTPDDGTTTEHDPDAVADVVAQLPGFTGVSGVTGLGAGDAAWVPVRCDLAPYAGKTVLLAFRTINDPASQGNGYLDAPGFYVDDVTVAGAAVSDGSSVAGLRSFSEVKPGVVSGFTVHIVSIESARKRVSVVKLPLTSQFVLRGKANVQRYVSKRADFVGAIVTYDDPDETSTQYAPYRLVVNGVLQPGGA